MLNVYGLIQGIAIVIAMTGLERINKRDELMEGNELDWYMYTVILIAYIGARAYYVIFNYSEYQDNLLDIFKVWQGGLAIYGGIITGLIYTYIFCKVRGIDVRRVYNTLVPYLAFGQMVGRWGNFYNQEAYGSIVTRQDIWYVPDFIANNMFIDGAYRQPTFLYESVGLLVILCIMGFINKEKYYSMYLIGYGLLRFFIEGMRADSLMLGQFRVSQIVSLVFILIGLYRMVKDSRESGDFVQ